MTCGLYTTNGSSPQRATFLFDAEIDCWIPEQTDPPETYSFARGRSGSRAVFTGTMNGGCVLCNRSPRTVIVDAADEWQADLIVVGSHGRTGLQRLVLGSVSQSVVAHAHCSGEVVRRRR